MGEDGSTEASPVRSKQCQGGCVFHKLYRKHVELGDGVFRFTQNIRKNRADQIFTKVTTLQVQFLKEEKKIKG